jgi:hypothetical protein
MRGEFIAVWTETTRELWSQLFDQEGIGADVYCELYRILAPALKFQLTVEALADILDDPTQSQNAFNAVISSEISGERELVNFFETAHEVLDDFGGDSLSNRYFNLLETFIQKFSLRYDLRRPCQLCPTLPGVFASLVRELRTVTASDAHLNSLMKDFEGAVRDLRADSSEGKIKTCIQKQMNLLEALGRAYPGVTETTLGKISDQVGTWPHEKLKLAVKNLYAFSCDYPGIRHGGSPANALRAIDMRDMVAVTILLTGFTPYLGNNVNAVDVFGAGIGPVRVAPVGLAVAAVSSAANNAIPQPRNAFRRIWNFLFRTQ